MGWSRQCCVRLPRIDLIVTDHEDLLNRLRAAAILAAKETIAAHMLPSGITVGELLGDAVRELAISAADAVLDATNPIIEAELRERDNQADVAMKVASRLAAAGATVEDSFGAS